MTWNEYCHGSRDIYLQFMKYPRSVILPIIIKLLRMSVQISRKTSTNIQRYFIISYLYRRKRIWQVGTRMQTVTPPLSLINLSTTAVG